MFLWIITYILIPAYTVLFVQGSNWFTTNFSVIGNIVGREEEFVLWGLMVGVYFFYCLQKIILRMAHPPSGTWLLPMAIVLLACAVVTPYLPEQLPFKSFLHVVFAFLSAACLMVCLFLLIWKLYGQNIKKYRPYLAGLAGIVFFSAFLLWIAGIISSILEIFFTLASVLMVRRLYQTAP